MTQNAQTHQELERLRTELQETRIKYLAARQEIIEKDKLLAEVYDSFSWRSTAPLRWIFRLLKINSIIAFFFPPNTKRGLLFNLSMVLIKDPARLIRNLTPRNIKLFLYQFGKMQPSALEYEVKRLISSGQAAASTLDTFDYFEMFATDCGEGNVLVIDRFMPAYDTNSGALRMFTILKILKELGYHVTFMPDDLQSKEPYHSELESLGIEVICGNINVEQFFRTRGPSFEIVILSEPQPAFNFSAMVRAYAVNCTLIYDTVDLHWVRLERAANITKSKEVVDEAAYFRKVEMVNMQAADVILTVTSDEKEYLATIDPNLRVFVLPNIHTVSFDPISPFTQRKDLMFIGHFLHEPNVDAVKYFVAEIFPILKRQIPELRFIIVGSNPTMEVMKLQSPDIEVTGYVKDVTPYFERSRVFVAPLRFGAGMKGKIGHSMTLGLPVVTTAVGAEGMGLKDGENVLIAETPGVFAEAVLKLYREEELWNRISSASREHISRNFSKDATADVISTIFSQIAPKD